MILNGSKTLNTVFIIGFGDIGKRVAQLWLKNGAALYTLARSQRADTAGINTLIADLDDPDSLKTLADQPTQDATLYYFAPPPNQGDHDPRVDHFLNAIHQSPRQLIYISTSGVYGDCNGEWIDETRPVNPDTPRSQRRYAAEQSLTRWCEQHKVMLTILRVGGIYAEERLPLERLAAGMSVVKRELAPYSNRIHADDLASICYAAAQHPKPFALYNVSDGHPTTMSDYFFSVAEAAGLPAPQELDWETAEQTLSPAMLSYLYESKRLNNNKLLQELDIALQYPTLKEGLKACRFKR